MTVKTDAEFFNKHANTALKVSTREQLEQALRFLVNCPDPHNFSKPGEHAHFFVVETKPDTNGKFTLHVSPKGMDCLSWWRRTYGWTLPAKE